MMVLVSMKLIVWEMARVILDTTKKYEIGNDIKLLNLPVSLLNAVQRITKYRESLCLPLQITSDDLEEFETIQEVRVDCILH